MNVILVQDVNNLGAANEIIKVKGGYARNYLIPSKLAVEASESNLKILQGKLRSLAIKEKKTLAELNKVMEKLQSIVLKVFVKVGSQGKIFGSITNVLLAREIRNQLDLTIDRKKISMPDYISDLGIYEAVVVFNDTQKVTFKFELLLEDK